eukprot:4971523-Amphidinium_carterae.1
MAFLSKRHLTIDFVVEDMEVLVVSSSAGFIEFISDAQDDITCRDMKCPSHGHKGSQETKSEHSNDICRFGKLGWKKKNVGSMLFSTTKGSLKPLAMFCHQLDSRGILI